MHSDEQSLPEIVVDDRERAAGLAQVLRRMAAGPVAVRRLAVGDVQIGERLVLERKEAADFVSSLLDGRLEDQLSRLVASKKTIALILEGEFDPRVLAGMAPRTVRQAMLAIQFDRQIPLIRSRDLSDTARWIAALAERERFALRPLAPTFASIPSPSGAHPAGHRTRRPSSEAQPSRFQSEALRRIPGVGLVRAAALLGRFGSIKRMLAVGEAELAAVEGIGPALARAIRIALNRGRR